MLVKHLAECPLRVVCLMFISWLDWGFQSLLIIPQGEVPFLSHRTMASTWHHSWYNTHHLVKGVSARSRRSKSAVFFFLSLLLLSGLSDSFGSESLSPDNTQTGVRCLSSVFWSKESYVYYLEIFCKRDFMLFIIYLFMLVWTHGYIFHILI